MVVLIEALNSVDRIDARFVITSYNAIIVTDYIFSTPLRLKSYQFLDLTSIHCSHLHVLFHCVQGQPLHFYYEISPNNVIMHVMSKCHTRCPLGPSDGQIRVFNRIK